MPDTKISALTDGVTANATDRIPVTRDPTGTPVNRYITPGYVRTYMLSLDTIWTGQNIFAEGTITANLPFSITQTWNNAGVTFTGLLVNITNTASNSGSMLFDFQLAGTSYFKMTRTGLATLNGGLYVTNTTGVQVLDNGGVFILGASQDTQLSRGAANVWSFGSASTGATFRAVPTTPAQITADQNNYNPGGSSYVQRWSTDASRNVTGMVFTTTQVSGQQHEIWNVGSFNIVLVHESASSTAANRFTTTTGANLTIAANGCAKCTYDATASRWRVYLC